MPISGEQQKILIKYLEDNEIEYQLSSPKTFTSSVSKPKALVINVKDKDKLAGLVLAINKLNADKIQSPINAAVIGGGRGGNNTSYSIGKIWEGVDVFVQLGWDLEFAKNPSESKAQQESLPETEEICRISPNMMLIELNQLLYKNNCHSPTLTGCLPFMSFAGGLSTGSHTAYGHLSDLVVGVK